MKKKILFAIGAMLLFCGLMFAQNTSSEIDACGQVKITSTGSLEVHNGGMVIIKNLSMEEDSELLIQ